MSSGTNATFDSSVDSDEALHRFHAPTDEVQSFYPHTYDTSARGTDGEIHVTIGPHFHTLDGIVRESFVNSGIQSLRDPNNGDVCFSCLKLLNGAELVY